MSDDSDTPTPAGACNVVLTQRSATPPYRRTEVNLPGDDHPVEAIGFDSMGRLGALNAATMIAADPAGCRVALEDPFTTVDTEAQFDAALAAGRSMVLRGEGSGGVIELTGPKVVTANHTTIKSETGAVLRFTLSPALAVTLQRGITIKANDVTLRNFELISSKTDLATIPDLTHYGIAFSEGLENLSHRTKLQDLVIHHWGRGISKDGNTTAYTTPCDDVLIERCYVHTWKDTAMWLHCGFNRLVVRDCRMFDGWVRSDVTVYGNGLHGGSDWRDCLIHNCHVKNVSRNGIEVIPFGELTFVHERTRVIACRVENWKYQIGFSLAFGTGILVSGCSAKGGIQAGIAIEGRVTGNPESGGNPTFLSQGIVEGCQVEGVTRTSVGCYGISLDGARDTIVRGCRIRNIVSTPTQGDVGIGCTDSERCSIQGNVIEDGGYVGIGTHGAYAVQPSGFHDISNNVIRNPSGYLGGSQVAVRMLRQGGHVRQNTAFRKSGSTLDYQSITLAGDAQVFYDSVAVAYSPDVNTPVVFAGTNVTLNDY